MHEASSVTDLIYEAAINAELWPKALDRAGRDIDAVSGELLVFDSPDSRPRVRATDFTRETLNHWVDTDLWKDSVMQRVVRAGAPTHPAGVLATMDLMSQEDWNADPTGELFNSVGLQDQLFAPIFMPTGEVVFLSFERLRRDGRFSPDAIVQVSALLPHFSRAAMVASRLGLAQATAATATMEALRCPAAVLSSAGKLKAVNGFFSRLEHHFTIGAMDRVRLTDATADTLFQNAIAEVSTSLSAVRSIAVRPRDTHLPAVLHVLPLRRSAHEILFGADVLVVMTEVGQRSDGPNANLLIALFDLTPAEAKLASLLGGGASVAESAVTAGITGKTARTYLERVFAKTGCRRQTELVLLLRDVGSGAPGA